MENYEEFVQRRLSQLRTGEEEEEEEHSRPSSASSLIRVYGRPILSPLLSGERRDEMRRHRDEAQKVPGRTKLMNDPRMAYVHTILHSVQLRTTPTLEELLQESDIDTKTLYSKYTSDGPVSKDIAATKDRLKMSPCPVRKEKDRRSPSPVTSTLSGTFSTSNVTPQQSHHEVCPVDQRVSQQGPLPNSPHGVTHQSPSSGYVAQESEENDIFVSAMTDAGSGCCGSDSPEEAYLDYFFLHGTSSTITNMPEIISSPPIDGEELEKSGLESIYCTSFQEESVICDHFVSENQSESSHVEHDKDHILDRCEEPVQSPEESCDSVNPDLLEILSTHRDVTRQLHSQQEPTEVESADSHVDEAKPPGEPRRLSLQALLKKSQEYRRCQRMLRSQTKSTKIQERIQQPKTRPEEQSLSDKENDESPNKGSVTKEEKKMIERSCTFSPTVQLSLWKSQESERLIESEFIQKKTNLATESAHLIERNNTNRNEEGATFKNNRLNISQEVLIEPKQTRAFILQPPLLTEASPAGQAFYMTTAQSDTCREGNRSTFPTSSFCTSPVHSKSKGAIRGQTADQAETLNGMVLVNTGLNDDHSIEEESFRAHQNIHTEVPSTLGLEDQGDAKTVSVKSSEHIDDLETTLSSLQNQISDLVSTVKENFENHSQTESNTQSEFSLEVSVEDTDQHLQPRQNDFDLVDNVGDYHIESCDAEPVELPGQSSDNSKNELDDTEPEPNLSDADDLSIIIRGKGKEAPTLREISHIPTSAIERVKQKATSSESPADSCGLRGSCRKGQPAAKCVLSAAQRVGIPNVFRDPPEIMVPCNSVSVLLDKSNHQVERRNEPADDKGLHSNSSSSLNQSYDVDTPSSMWLSVGSGSGTKGQRVQEKHLTPKSGSEGQGGGSKVKRRLLMHGTEEAQKSSEDTNGGGSFAVRPISSTPRAAACRYEAQGGHKNKQEQMRQANAAQIRALQDEHRRQQEELLQTLAVRYHFLQSVSVPCSMSSSRLWDTLTFPTLSQPPSPLSERFRPLLSAAVRGFLTRRLFKSERVAQLVRTVRDTEQFLHALQLQTPGRPELGRRQDLLLQGRVTLQLRAARYDIYDIFFSMSTGERMQIISWDRDLARERELRRQSGHTGNLRGNSLLSAATLKSLERKKRMMINKVTTDRHREVVKNTGHKTRVSAKQPQQTQRGQFRANPLRVPKSTHSTRPR